MIELCDRVKLMGELTIKVYDVKDGCVKLLRRMTNKNQVTNNGRQVLIDLLGQMGMTPTISDPTYNQLWSFEAGTDDTPTTVGDVGLGATAWTSRFLAPEVSVIPSPTFEIFIDKIMPTTAAIGSDLAEAGLFTRGNNDLPALAANRRLYARQTHPIIPKNDHMMIEYTWHLAFTVI